MRYALAANLRSRQRLEASVIFLAVDEALLFYSVFECHEIYFSGRCFSRAFWASSRVRNLNTPRGYCLGAMAHQRAQCRRNRSEFAAASESPDLGSGALFISSIERNFCTLIFETEVFTCAASSTCPVSGRFLSSSGRVPPASRPGRACRPLL